MNRRTVASLVVFAAMVAATLVWWFWPREQPEVIVVWQSQPEFTAYSR